MNYWKKKSFFIIIAETLMVWGFFDKLYHGYTQEATHAQKRVWYAAFCDFKYLTYRIEKVES